MHESQPLLAPDDIPIMITPTCVTATIVWLCAVLAANEIHDRTQTVSW